ETVVFNNNIEFNIRNEEILEDPEIIPGPTTNENNETMLETVDTTQDQNTTINGIIKDLTEERVNSPFRVNPLLTFSWKNKVNKIIRIILNEFQNNPKVSKEIRRLLNDSLGSHKIYNFWKGASWIYQVLQPQELSR
ncbi:8162_t:CDS:2, partial [Gigaspora rosea]